MTHVLEPPPVLSETYDRVRREYGGAIGRHRTELTTPALVLDLPAAKRNIDNMAARIAQLPAETRPHIKVHKSPELSRLQVEAGAIGLSVAATWFFIHSAHAIRHVGMSDDALSPNSHPPAADKTDRPRRGRE